MSNIYPKERDKIEIPDVTKRTCAYLEGVGAVKNHKNIGFLSHSGPDPLNNHKATKPTFNVRPSSARQRNAIKFHWKADGAPLIVVFGSSLPLSTKKVPILVGPPLTFFFLNSHMKKDIRSFRRIIHVGSFGR